MIYLSIYVYSFIQCNKRCEKLLNWLKHMHSKYIVIMHGKGIENIHSKYIVHTFNHLLAA